MDVSQLFELMANIPWWGWVVGVIVVLSIFGDKKIWEYEVDFHYKEGVGKGEVEFELFTRNKPKVSLELDLDSQYVDKEIEVSLKGQRVMHLPTPSGKRIRHSEEYRGERPALGDQVEVKIAGEVIFSGSLKED